MFLSYYSYRLLLVKLYFDIQVEFVPKDQISLPENAELRALATSFKLQSIRALSQERAVDSVESRNSPIHGFCHHQKASIFNDR
jgi:hypothetical protein